MRRVLPFLLLLALALPAGAQAKSSYCSPTGDYCTSTRQTKGAVRLYLGTFSFRGKVDVCVTAPDGTKACKPFTLRQRPKGVYVVDAKWSAHFPRKGAGTYRATFAPKLAGGVPIGPVLTFTRKS